MAKSDINKEINATLRSLPLEEKKRVNEGLKRIKRALPYKTYPQRLARYNKKEIAAAEKAMGNLESRLANTAWLLGFIEGHHASKLTVKDVYAGVKGFDKRLVQLEKQLDEMKKHESK